MTRLRNTLSRFVTNESGATAIEYGLIVALIGVGIIASLSYVRDGMNNNFTYIGDTIKAK